MLIVIYYAPKQDRTEPTLRPSHCPQLRISNVVSPRQVCYYTNTRAYQSIIMAHSAGY